jgi:hypothetical protein
MAMAQPESSILEVSRETFAELRKKLALSHGYHEVLFSDDPKSGRMVIEIVRLKVVEGEK